MKIGKFRQFMAEERSVSTVEHALAAALFAVAILAGQSLYALLI